MRQVPQNEEIGSPAWARTTITIRDAESVSYRDLNGLECRIGPEKPPLVHNSYTALIVPAGPALVSGLATTAASCGGRVTRHHFWGRCFLFNVTLKAARGRGVLGESKVFIE